MGLRLSGAGVVLQAPLGEGLFLDPRPLGQDGLAPTEVDIGRREVAQALVGTGVVVVLDEGCDLLRQGTRQIVVLEQDAVLQGLVPALDLALRLGVPGGTPDVGHTFVFEPLREVTGNVACRCRSAAWAGAGP